MFAEGFYNTQQVKNMPGITTIRNNRLKQNNIKHQKKNKLYLKGSRPHLKWEFHNTVQKRHSTTVLSKAYCEHHISVYYKIKLTLI